MSANRTGGGGYKRERLRAAAVEALLRSGSVREAAEAIGVAPSTLLRWLQDPDFRAAFEAARERALEHAIAQLQAATAEAVQALRRNLGCGNPSVEVRAATAVLDAALKVAEHFELRQRVARIEQLLDRLEKGGVGVG